MFLVCERSSDVDVARFEQVEAELDAMIRRRDTHRRQTEGERLEEELYEPSVRAWRERREAENRAAWCEHYRHMRALHGGLADEYGEKLKRLEMANAHENGHKESG
jgi:hypothetical protein